MGMKYNEMGNLESQVDDLRVKIPLTSSSFSDLVELSLSAALIISGLVELSKVVETVLDAFRRLHAVIPHVEAHRLDICLIILGVIPLFLTPQLDVEDGPWGLSFEKLLVVRGLRLFRLVRVLRMLSNFKLVWRLVYSLFAAGRL